MHIKAKPLLAKHKLSQYYHILKFPFRMHTFNTHLFDHLFVHSLCCHSFTYKANKTTHKNVVLLRVAKEIFVT